MKANHAAFIAATVVAMGSYSGLRWYKLSHYSRWLATVSIGDTKDAVLEKMGTPDVVQARPHWLWCYEQACESEFMYGHSIPPEWWVVGFDRDGRAVWTAELQSP